MTGTIGVSEARQHSQRTMRSSSLSGGLNARSVAVRGTTADANRVCVTERAVEFASRFAVVQPQSAAGEFARTMLTATPNVRACTGHAADPRVAVTADQLGRREPTCDACKVRLEDARREAAR